jgi:membrane associated rhomboid family serine protease
MNSYGSYGSSEEHQPVVYLRGYALYAAHMIVLVYVVSMLVTTLLQFGTVGQVLNWLIFTSDHVLRGQVWRILTYGFVNPPSLGFVIDMFMIVWFGRELEKFFGRRTFLHLYAGLYLITPLLFTLIGLTRPMAYSGATGAFALFVAFATLYPNVPLIFNILAKWAAVILVGIFTLMALAGHDWVGLVSLWATVGFAFAFVRYHQGHFTLPRFRWPARKPKLRVLPDLPANKAEPRRVSPSSASMAEVDALLDKIAKSGISSLTGPERAKLDAARENLKRRASNRG